MSAPSEPSVDPWLAWALLLAFGLLAFLMLSWERAIKKPAKPGIMQQMEDGDSVSPEENDE